MRAGEIVREALASARAQRVPTLMVAAVALAMCATTVLTVGRSAAAEADVRASLEAAGSRVVQVTDTGTTGILTHPIQDTIAALSTVERSLATARPVDARSAVVGTGGDPVPVWRVRGDLTGALTLTQGRWPTAGEAVVTTQAQHTLALDGPVGAVLTATGAEYPVVGIVTPRDPFDQDYAAGGFVADPDAPVTSITVIASLGTAVTTQQAMLAIIATTNPADLQVISPATVADLEAAVTGSVADFGASLLVLVLTAGAVLTFLVVLSDILVRSRDLGRRRALGAERFTIIALVTLRTLAPATIGAILGAGAGMILTARSGTAPPLTFAAGTAILAIVCAALAAIPPATLAAYRDPVAVLRTP